MHYTAGYYACGAFIFEYTFLSFLNLKYAELIAYMNEKH